MISLNIIIVNWNTKGLLKNCLKSIYKHTSNLDYEVLVVDNASSDGSVEMIEKEFPQVKLIKNEENVGFARANNQAIRKSKGRYILLLNPDTLILNQAIEKMVDFMIKNKKVGILGPKIFGKDGSLQISCYRFDSLSTLFSTNIFFNKLGKGYSYKKFDFNQTKKVDIVTGACLLTKREVIEDIGFLDEDFFIYSEDADWCFRAKKKDWEVVFYPTAEIIHFGGASCEKIQEEASIEAYSSRIKFLKKHFNKAKVKAMSALLFIGVFLRLIILFFLIYLKPIPENKIRLQKYWAVFKWYLL